MKQKPRKPSIKKFRDADGNVDYPRYYIAMSKYYDELSAWHEYETKNLKLARKYDLKACEYAEAVQTAVGFTKNRAARAQNLRIVK